MVRSIGLLSLLCNDLNFTKKDNEILGRVIMLLDDSETRNGLTRVGSEYSCSLWKIYVVKTINDGNFSDVARISFSYRATIRRILI